MSSSEKNKKKTDLGRKIAKSIFLGGGDFSKTVRGIKNFNQKAKFLILCFLGYIQRDDFYHTRFMKWPIFFLFFSF